MKTLPLALTILSALASTNTLADDEKGDVSVWNTYRVTIANATVNQVITPPAIIAHNRDFKLFNIAEPASTELSVMAESGNVSPLLESLAGNANVSAVMSSLEQNPRVILPGSSITVAIKAPKQTYFTVASMLATTNDAFTSATLKAPGKIVIQMLRR